MTPDFILWMALNFTIQFALFLRTTRCARGVALTLAGFGLYSALGIACIRILLPLCGSTATMIQCCFFPFYLLIITLLLLLMKGGLGHRLFICLESTVYCAAFILSRHLFATRLPPGLLRHLLAFGAPILIALILFFKIIPLLERMPRRANWKVLNLVAAGSVLFVFFSCFWPVWVAAGNWTDLVRGGFALVVALAILPLGLVYVASLRRDYAAQQIADNERLLRLQVKALDAEAEAARRIRHDLRHHIEALHALLETGDLAAARTYLGNLSDHELLRSSVLKRWCANELVNGLVNLAAMTALRRGLDFTADIRLAGAFPVGESDLVSLLGNLLENANLHGTGMVHLNLHTEDGVLRLAVQNGVTSGFALAEGLPAAERGVGLMSIEAIVRKYNGLLKYTLEDGILSALVFIGK